MKYCIVGNIPDVYSDIIEEFDTLKEAQDHFAFLINPKCLDPWYDDFSEAGGSIRIEDEKGNGY